MKNTTKTKKRLAGLLLSLLVSGMALAENLQSPNGNLELKFSVNNQGEPIYELYYKGKAVIKPSKLGLELKDDPGLMSGFTIEKSETAHSTRPGNPSGARKKRSAIITMNWPSRSTKRLRSGIS